MSTMMNGRTSLGNVSLLVILGGFLASCGPAHIAPYTPKVREPPAMAEGPAAGAPSSSGSLFQPGVVGAGLFVDARAYRINDVVVLTGDIHTSWAMDLTETPTDAATYDPMTGRGSLAVEFVTPAVTSPGFPPGIVTNTAAALLARNTYMKYFDLVRRGFIILDATPTRLQGAFFHYEHGATFVPDAVTEAFSGAWSTVPGRNHLERDSMAATPRSLLSRAAEATNSCMQRSPCGTGKKSFTRASR